MRKRDTMDLKKVKMEEKVDFCRRKLAERIRQLRSYIKASKKDWKVMKNEEKGKMLVKIC